MVNRKSFDFIRALLILNKQCRERALLPFSLLKELSSSKQKLVSCQTKNRPFICKQQVTFLQFTGCPVKLSTFRFCYFLGFQITYKRTSDHFSIAQKIRISKLTLLYFLRETFIKLQDKMRDKLDFDSIILMADFVPS